MIRPQFSLDLNAELIVDNFAGGGGASCGIEQALGRHVDHAINHCAEALGMHRINHPQTIHHCEDIFDIDPLKVTEGRPVGLAHFSPDCKHFSKAKGGKPLDKRIRGLVLVMLRWAKIRARVMTMENVEEITTWGPLIRLRKKGKWGWYPDPAHKGRTWKAFLAILGNGIDPTHPDLPEILSVLNGTVTLQDCVRGFGYNFEAREIRASDLGAPTIRKRLYMVARCDGRPIIWPDASHYEVKEIAVNGGDRRGKLPWRTIAECIDWNLPCPSIFLTRRQARLVNARRPLAKATMRRIATGMDRYVLKAKQPFIVNLTHGVRVQPIDEPARTLTGANRGEKSLVAPVMVPRYDDRRDGRQPRCAAANEPIQTITAGANVGVMAQACLAPILTEHANASKQRTFRANEPMRTQCGEVKGGHFALISGTLVGAGGRAAQSRPRELGEPLHTVTAKADTCLAAASLVKMRGDPLTHPSAPATDPAHTISAGGQHHGVMTAYLAQHNGGFNETTGHAATEPISTISSKGSQQQIVASSLVKYYGTDQDPRLDEPSHSVTTRDRFGLVESTAVCPLTLEQIAGALRVAKFLRAHGVQFDGEFATVDGFVIVDIGMRMLTPRELFRAQGFQENYVIDRAWIIDPKTGSLREILLTKEQQIRMCGNSVCPPVMEGIVRSNVPEMAVWYRGERSGGKVVRAGTLRSEPARMPALPVGI